MNDAARIPVIVGVGQVNDRPATPDAGLDSLGLMEAALRAADADAGGAVEPVGTEGDAVMGADGDVVWRR